MWLPVRQNRFSYCWAVALVTSINRLRKWQIRTPIDTERYIISFSHKLTHGNFGQHYCQYYCPKLGSELHCLASGVSNKSLVISVRKGPGQIAFTRMPYCAHSSAKTLVSWVTPAFEAQYEDSPTLVVQRRGENIITATHRYMLENEPGAIGYTRCRTLPMTAGENTPVRHVNKVRQTKSEQVLGPRCAVCAIISKGSNQVGYSWGRSKYGITGQETVRNGLMTAVILLCA